MPNPNDDDDSEDDCGADIVMMTMSYPLMKLLANCLFGGWQTRSDGFVGNHCLRSVLTRESPFSTVSISIASRAAAVHINPISPSALQPSVLTMLILTPASPSLPQAICLLSVCLV